MYLFVDTETAGLDHTRSPILTLAGIVTDLDFKDKYSFHFCIKPNMIKYPIIEIEAIRINGLSIAELSDYGYDSDEVHSEMLKVTNGEKYTLVGWNVRFDRAFMSQVTDDTQFAHRRDIDLCGVYQFLYPLQEKYSLSSAADYFGIKREKEHNALEDCFITLEIARKMRCLPIQKSI